MAGLIANLLVGTRALTAQSKGVEIAGKNLSNISTPGYSRQRVELGSRAMLQTAQGTEGSGLEATGLQQLRDQFLDGAVLRETSNTSALQARADVLSRGQTALGENLDRTADSTDISGPVGGTSSGISTSMSDFFSSFQALAASPTSPAARQAVLQQGTDLANRINTADARLAQVQNDTTAQINQDVETVNGILKSVAKLNSQIANAEIGGAGNAPELRDQRQAKLEELAGYINFSVSPSTASPGDQLQVSVTDSTGASVSLLKGGEVEGNVAFDGAGFTSGTPPTNLALTGGSLPSRVTVRDQDLQGVRNDLQKLASQITTSVNAAYNPSAAPGGDFFANPPTSGVMGVNPSLTASNLQTSASGSAGANDLALAVSNVGSTSYSTASGAAINGTPAGFEASIVSSIGSKVASANSDLENQQLVQTAVADQRDSVSGVSVDEETADLLRFQRGFQASARFVTVMDELLSTVVNQLGAR